MFRITQSKPVAFIFLALAIPVLAQHAPSSGGTNPGRSSSSKSKSDRSLDQAMPTFVGTVRGSGKRLITIEDSESNTMVFNCTRKTAYYNGKEKVKTLDLNPGDRVSIEARKAPDGTLDAIEIHREPAGI